MSGQFKREGSVNELRDIELSRLDPAIRRVLEKIVEHQNLAARTVNNNLTKLERSAFSPTNVLFIGGAGGGVSVTGGDGASTVTMKYFKGAVSAGSQTITWDTPMPVAEYPIVLAKLTGPNGIVDMDPVSQTAAGATFDFPEGGTFDCVALYTA